MKNKFTIFFIFINSIYILKAEPQVRVKQGILKGINQLTENGRNISAFLGIPFGKPPIGKLRFKSPVPIDNWDGVRNADSYGSPCLQTLFGFATFGQEDCLNLDVYTPFLDFQENKLTNNTLLPVMVYIYGGAYFFGSSATYNGSYFLDKDVILVIMNYRVGIFGFLSTGDKIAPGNFGMKDQVLALKWVQKNIMSFGGDRNRVTIFGLSSGASSVHFHALSNASNGLFQQYIMQSGTGLSTFAYRNSSEIFETVKKVATLVFCPIFPTKGLVNCLRKKSAESLLAVSNLVGFVVRVAEFAWVPTNEPITKDAFLTDHPKNLLGQMKDLPFISGVVPDESLFFLNFLYSFNILYFIMKKILKTIIVDEAVYPFNNEKKLPSKLVEFYLNNSLQNGEKIQELNAYTKLTTDGYFMYPEVKMLETITPKMKNNNYLYSYKYRNTFSVHSLMSGDSKKYGIDHSNDLFSFFPIKYGPIDTSHLKFSATDKKIRKLMIDLWTSFATNGIPKSGEMNITWEPYNTQNNSHLQILNIKNNKDPVVAISHDFFKKRMDLWKKYWT